MGKKLIFILIFSSVIFGILFYFLAPVYKGIKPAILPTSENIVKKSSEKNNLGLFVKDGFSISIFAGGLSAPRVLARDPEGNILTSIPSLGKVVALPDKNNDGVADEMITVAEGLNKPHGLAFKCEEKGKCRLFIAETDKVAAYDYDQNFLKASNKKKIIDLPAGGNHTTRTIIFHNGRLLISVGSSCNVCNESDARRAKVLSVDPDGTDMKVFSSGLRNAVFMAENPADGKLWATEMGRDLLSDDLPPDEINILSEGKNYGWPVCYGKNIHDTNFDKNVYIRNPCEEPFETPSYIDIPAHSAPLGLAFSSQNDLFIAYHGSWNRSIPTGYKIVRYKINEKGEYFGEEDLISGWLLPDGTASGRPVDILSDKDALYISDDKAGVIYKVSKN